MTIGQLKLELEKTKDTLDRVRRERNDFEVELLTLRELLDNSHAREREIVKRCKVWTTYK